MLWRGRRCKKGLFRERECDGKADIDEAVAKKADRLILSCPACYAQVNEAMQGHDKQTRITDSMELLGSLVEE